MHHVYLVHLLIIWAAVAISGRVADKTRLTPVLWYLFAGAFLTNLGWLPAEPLPFVEGVAELGIILIMFALGFEESIENFLSAMKRSWGVAFFGALAPFFTAYWLALAFWDDRSVALMCGLAMTATAVSLTMVSLRSEGLSRTRAATGIMSAAVLDDIASLALVAILVPLAAGSTVTGPEDIAWIMGKAVLFFVIVVVVTTWIFPPDIKSGIIRYVPGLRDVGISHLLQMSAGTQVTLVMMLVAVSLALLGELLGFHPAVGAYFAGLALREEYFVARRQPDQGAYERARHIIDDMAFNWIGPVFFVVLGGSLVFDWALVLSVSWMAVGLFLALFVAQVLSAGLAARFTGGFAWHESAMIGFGMLGRAELAFVVMGIAYLQYPILSDAAFYTLMLTAALLNIAVPLAIRWWKPYYVGRRPLPGWMQSPRGVEPDPGISITDPAVTGTVMPPAPDHEVDSEPAPGGDDIDSTSESKD